MRWTDTVLIIAVNGATPIGFRMGVNRDWQHSALLFLQSIECEDPYKDRVNEFTCLEDDHLGDVRLVTLREEMTVRKHLGGTVPLLYKISCMYFPLW